MANINVASNVFSTAALSLIEETSNGWVTRRTEQAVVRGNVYRFVTIKDHAHRNQQVIAFTNGKRLGEI